MDFFNKGLGEVEGLFGWQHLIFSLISIIMTIMLVVSLRNCHKDKLLFWLKIIFIIAFGLEILKIIWNLTIRDDKSPNNWIPLYFCSLYLYALPLSIFGKKKIKLMGNSFLFFGGLSGGIAFMLYPSSSLPIFPFLQVLTIHSLVYHVLLVATAIIIVITGYYQPQLKDIWAYLIFTISMSIITLIINYAFDVNIMFISEPGFIEPLIMIKNIFGLLYSSIIIIGQSLGAFFFSYLCYAISSSILKKGKWKNV